MTFATISNIATFEVIDPPGEPRVSLGELLGKDSFTSQLKSYGIVGNPREVEEMPWK